MQANTGRRKVKERKEMEEKKFSAVQSGTADTVLASGQHQRCTSWRPRLKQLIMQMHLQQQQQQQQMQNGIERTESKKKKLHLSPSSHRQNRFIDQRTSLSCFLSFSWKFSSECSTAVSTSL